jgi:hypothetical protein
MLGVQNNLELHIFTVQKPHHMFDVVLCTSLPTCYHFSLLNSLQALLARGLFLVPSQGWVENLAADY